MKRSSITTALLLVLISFSLPSCYVLKKYVYTDEELNEHYQTKALKPTYKKLDFLNRTLHYATISKNDTLPLLIFVHGAPGAWYGYLNLMDDSLLQANFKMVSIDRMGYGKSDYGKAELSTQIQALEIKRIVEAENTSRKKIFLLGRSYGAPIAAWFAINYPQQVERLLMASPVIDPEHEKFYWFSRIGKWHITQLILPQLLNVATKEKYSHEMEMKKMLDKWKKLYVRTSVLTGAEDRIADTANFSFAKRMLINCPCTFNKIPNTGHLVTRQHPEIVKEFLLEKN